MNGNRRELRKGNSEQTTVAIHWLLPRVCKLPIQIDREARSTSHHNYFSVNKHKFTISRQQPSVCTPFRSFPNVQFPIHQSMTPCKPMNHQLMEFFFFFFSVLTLGK